MKVFSFGDSWGYGSELKPKEIPFGQIIANNLGVEHINLSKEGMSFPCIMFEIFDHAKKINEDDVVLIIIPPDIRWYSMDPAKKFYTVTPFKSTEEEWKNYVLKKPLEWFIHHHNLFMFSIQSLLKEKKCKYMMAHNYGTLKIVDPYVELIDTSVFLSDMSLTKLLGSNDWKENYTKDSDGPDIEFTGKYFAGNITHPNQLGHKKIAELINQKMKLYKIDEVV